MKQQALARRASDVMQRDVITLAPETPILDVYRMFVEEEIHGAPVVDESGAVRGVVSTLDLLRFGSEEAYVARDSSGQLTADDAATRELVTVGPDATVEEVARTMLAQHVHRVLVVDKDRELLGVISTFDLLRIVASLDGQP
jgi:CBS domain-containing protein